ncbi:MAG: exodeoxyribonuclease gamma subunit [Verrucomicrobiota bacterium]
MTETPQPSASLSLFTSNRLETLAGLLADSVRAPLTSPFEADVIVVQSRGMARWLQFELARRLGICAHVRFPFPKAFAWELFHAADPTLAADADIEPAILGWRLMRLLPVHAHDPGFQPVADYLREDPDGRKCFQLAGRLAHLFDQYLIYRPEMILRWEQGRARPGEEWQAALWRALAKESETVHPAKLAQVFSKALGGGAPIPLPSRLAIFGISALPPFYVEIFETLARRVPVSLFLLQPTAEYWGDLDSERTTMRRLRKLNQTPSRPSALHSHAGNRLLASLGNQGRDFLNVLLDVTEFHARDHFAPPAEDSLLHWVQSDIYHLRDRAETLPALAAATGSEQDVGAESAPGKTVVADGDDSIEVHSCHSPLRELEVLQDQMLSWFEKDPDLAPQDVLVMMPDIETYAPMVDAVFGAAQRDARFIPFSIADRGTSGSSDVLSAFLGLLNLAGGRLGAASVLALLETRAIRLQFGIAESDLPVLRRWTDQSRIRWGRDAAHRAAFEMPALAENTWRHGLDRLLLGYAMHGTSQRLFEGILPCDPAGNRDGELLGSFVRFTDSLFAAATLLETPRTTGGWLEVFREMVRTFFAEEESTAPELRVLLATLTKLETDTRLAAFIETVPLAVLVEYLGPALAEDHLNTGFITGRVTFGALKPMRSIPFKIICLLGMDDNAFPRADPRAGFDLMARAPRLGDQSRREDDRYLFLETLLSARSKFYLSYVGQSVRDNSPAPPSVLVSELLDYVDQGFERTTSPSRAGSGHETSGIRDPLVVHHRLQAFNAGYFQPGGRLFSYSTENFAACAALRDETNRAPFMPEKIAAPDPSWRNVSVAQLIGFFGNPSRFFCIERLKLRLPRAAGAIADRELIEVDALDAYDLKLSLLARRIHGNPAEETRTLLKAGGRLPLGRVGDARLGDLCNEVEAFHDRIAALHPGTRLEPRVIDLTVDDFRITGELAPRTSSGQLICRPAVIKGKDLIVAWVLHLLNQAGGGAPGERTFLIGEKARGRSAVKFLPVGDPAGILSNLLEIYWSGLSAPLKFFPATSLAFADAEPEMANAAAIKAWHSDEYGRRDDSDEYFALCFAGADPLDTTFALFARSIFAPLLQHEEVLE